MLYCFIGCNTVSACASKGKIHSFKVMMNSEEYINLFLRVGINEFVNEKMHWLERLPIA